MFESRSATTRQQERKQTWKERTELTTTLTLTLTSCCLDLEGLQPDRQKKPKPKPNPNPCPKPTPTPHPKPNPHPLTRKRLRFLSCSLPPSHHPWLKVWNRNQGTGDRRSQALMPSTLCVCVCCDAVCRLLCSTWSLKQPLMSISKEIVVV